MTLKTSQYANLNQAVADAVSQGRDLFIDGDVVAPQTVRVPKFDSLRIWSNGDDGRVIPTFPSGDVLYFGDSVGEQRNLLLDNFAIAPSADRQAGFGVRMDRCVRTTINNVDVGNPETAMHSVGIWFNGYDDCRLDDSNIYAKNKCVLVNGWKDQGYGADIVLGGGNKFQNHKKADMSDLIPGAVGIHLAGGQGGTYVDATQAIFCGIGILIDKSVAGIMNREIFLNPGTVIDSCAEDGIRVMGDSFGTLQMTGVWSASHGRKVGSGGCGIRIQPGQAAIATAQMNGCRFFNNAGDGAAINGGYVVVSGGTVSDHNGGFGVQVANKSVQGFIDSVGLRGNKAGTLRNVSEGFKAGAIFTV